MIKGNLGNITIEEKTLLSGSNHIVVSYLAKDDLESLKAGTAVKIDGGKIEHIETDTEDAIGIVYEGFEGKTKDTTVPVVIFGAVKISAVSFSKDAKPCTAGLVEKLRKNGVYAIG